MRGCNGDAEVQLAGLIFTQPAHYNLRRILNIWFIGKKRKPSMLISDTDFQLHVNFELKSFITKGATNV